MKKVSLAFLFLVSYSVIFSQNVTLDSILKSKDESLAFRKNFYALTTCLKDYESVAVAHIKDMEAESDQKKIKQVKLLHAHARENVNSYLVMLASCLNVPDEKKYQKYNLDLKKALLSIKKLYEVLEVDKDLSLKLGMNQTTINDLVKYTSTWEFEILNCTESGKAAYSERLKISYWNRYGEWKG